jgi:nicotinamidase-related amidase
MRNEFIAVDVQNEFASDGGKFYTPKPSIGFLNKILFPYLREHDIKINEIVSDYRQPRPGDGGDGCCPGAWGYESLIPDELRKSLWVKCMNSPIWIRDGIGNKDTIPGKPFPDSNAFGKWVEENLGTPDDVRPIIFGLTIDCCVLSTVQEFRWRGFEPIVIREAVDHTSGREDDKNIVLEKTAIRWWARVFDWTEFKEFSQ